MTETGEAQKGSPTKFEVFRHCETKFFDKKTWYSAFYIKFFHSWNFLKHRRVPHWNFSVLSDKTILTENWDTLRPLIHKLFRYQKFSETPKGSPTKFFVSIMWDEKTLTKLWCRPLLCMKNFDTGLLLKNWRVPPRKFLVLWDKKKLDRKSLYKPFIQ